MGSGPAPPARVQKQRLRQEFWGVPRTAWLPLLAFAGGTLLFLLVDLLCFLLSRAAPPTGH